MSNQETTSVEKIVLAALELNAANSGSSGDLVSLIASSINPVDLNGKVVLIHMPHRDEPLTKEESARYNVYGEVLKGLGARTVVFLAVGQSMAVLDDAALEKIGLRRV